MQENQAQTSVHSAAAAQAAAAASSPIAVPNSVKIETLLEACIKYGASDLHIQVGLPPILRIDGSLVPIPNTPILTTEIVDTLIFSTLDSMQRETLAKDKEFDYSFAFGEIARFRVNAFNEKGHLAAAFRLIPTKMPTIEELGMPQVISGFADYPRGLVLVTGPTGSGKSTTLAAIINKINSEKSVHILTIEDPIEFTHKSKRSLVAQREVHYDTYSFSQSVDRMIDVFPAEQQPQIRSQLAGILMAVCSQRLVPAIGGGRVCAAEIMVANTAIRSIIREGKTHQLDTAIQTGASEGMQTMDRTLAKLVQQGTVTYDSAREYAVDVREFERIVKGA